MLRRRGGFTLIELLVVIAIIGILAALLFPVFARARESARKVACLSNIKNIALAIQMYLGDYNDTFPPDEHRSEVLDYFDVLASEQGWPSGCIYLSGINPFLRWPVILDEYTKNRDVWRCPSAKLEGGPAAILPTDWFGALKSVDKSVWGRDGLQIGCFMMTFPPGWGGTVTDSLTQGTPFELLGSGEYGSFAQSIGTGALLLRDTKLSRVEDPVQLVVCGDASNVEYQNAAHVIFPDNCMTYCGSDSPAGCCSGGDNTTESTDILAAEKHSIWDDGNVMSAHTRHLGGSNLGFADGHAAWWKAQAIVSATRWSKKTAAGSWSNDGPLIFAISPHGIWGPTGGCLCQYGQ